MGKWPLPPPSPVGREPEGHQLIDKEKLMNY